MATVISFKDSRDTLKVLELIKKHNAFLEGFLMLGEQWQGIPGFLEFPEYKEHMEEVAEMREDAKELCRLANSLTGEIVALKGKEICYGVTLDGYVKEFGSEANMIVYKYDD